MEWWLLSRLLIVNSTCDLECNYKKHFNQPIFKFSREILNLRQWFTHSTHSPFFYIAWSNSVRLEGKHAGKRTVYRFPLGTHTFSVTFFFLSVFFRVDTTEFFFTDQIVVVSIINYCFFLFFKFILFSVFLHSFFFYIFIFLHFISFHFCLNDFCFFFCFVKTQKRKSPTILNVFYDCR